MRFVILGLVIANLILFMVVAVRMKDAPEPAPRPAAAAAAPAAKEEPPRRGSRGSARSDDKAPGERFVDAMNNKGGADAPPGLEGAVGVSGRNEVDIDVEGDDPNALQDTQAEGLDDAKDRMKDLPLVGGR